MQNQAKHTLPGVRWCFESMDRMRRRRGESLDRVGYGPQSTASEILLDTPLFRLHAYGGDSNAPVALIVPAPIKRHYIWDLAPQRSVVQRALRSGLRLFLIEWKDPQDHAGAAGLDEYADTLIGQCIDEIVRRSGKAPLFLLAHSLGGVLTTIYAALHPERVAGLVLIETPLHFALATGSFRSLLAVAPAAAEVTRVFQNVPGSVLSMASLTASPTTFALERYADLVASMPSREAMRVHLQVERWTLDEAAMAPQLFEQVVEQLYREDLFYRGSLSVSGRTLGPRDVRAPMLAVYDPRSRIIPPASVIAFQEAAASTAKHLSAYHGDVGVGLAHVGVLVGASAHRQLWPEIFEWMHGIRCGMPS
jgi:polyhydroxyalkanoate synthase subunit PhaC